MRRAISLLAALMLDLLTLPSSAADFWIKKNYLEGNDKEVEFVTELGSMEFRCKLVPREMIAGGRLQF